MPEYSSAKCCLQASIAEEIARTVSYRPDRDRSLADAKYWRAQEQAALLREADARS